MKPRSISVSSTFPASADVIWERLQKIQTLQYIAAPYAYFRPTDPDARLVWETGAVLSFKLRVFGFIPMGTHTIAINFFDKNTYTVESAENNRFVPLWKHTIVLEPQAHQTGYTDYVGIYAGPSPGWCQCGANPFTDTDSGGGKSCWVSYNFQYYT